MAHVVGTLSVHDQFKIRYADRISKYLSSTSILQRYWPFRDKEKTGEKFVMPVLLRRGHSADYAASQAGQVAFGDLDTSLIEKAELAGSQIFMGDGCDWESAFSGGEGKSFSEEFDLVATGLMDSHRFRVEVDLLWGQVGLGVVSGVPATSATSTVTLTTASVSRGILFNLEGAQIEIFNAALDTKRAGQNADDSFTVISVDPDAGTFVVDNTAGEIDNTDVVFFRGARTTTAHKSGAGFHVWASNTTLLAGIDAADHILWKPNIVSAGNGPLNFDLLLDFTARLGDRGHKGKLVCICTTTAWNNMMSDMSAVVRRTQSERKYVLGAKAITFFTGTGEVEVVAHPYQKNGFAHIFPIMPTNDDGEYSEEEADKAPVRRIGAVDISFVGPDGKLKKRETYWEKLQRTNILYMETYSHQAPFVACPSRIGLINNIVNE